MLQTTLKDSIHFSGVGLHSGKFIKVAIHPAYADSGIRFRRTDVQNTEYHRITPYNVQSTQLATTINCGDLPVSTIEHVMSALYGLGIDNALVDVSGPEMPILDGSSAPVVELLAQSGIKTLNKKRKYLKFKKRIRLERDGKWIEIIPSRFFKITNQISFDAEVIGTQKAYYQMDPVVFMNDIAKARTFGFKKDVEALWKMGLAKGGSLDNAVVVDENGSIMNEEGLRFSDEFVRHKVLDLVGDISLVGYRIFGHIRAYKTGHMLNNVFARTLLESTGCYDIVELSDMEESHYMYNRPLVFEPQGTV